VLLPHYKIYHGNSVLIKNKQGYYSSLGSQKDANLCLQCTKTRLAAGLRPDLLVELTDFRGLLLRERTGKEGTEREEREEEGEKEGWNREGKVLAMVPSTTDSVHRL